MTTEQTTDGAAGLSEGRKTVLQTAVCVT